MFELSFSCITLGSYFQWRLEVRQRGGSGRNQSRVPSWAQEGGQQNLSRGEVLPFFARTKFRGGPRPLGPNGPGATGYFGPLFTFWFGEFRLMQMHLRMYLVSQVFLVDLRWIIRLNLR